MWQRVQTLYMGISTLLMAIMLFSVKATEYGNAGEVTETYRYLTYVPYAALIIIILILNAIALTTWKFRVFQYRTAVLTALVTMGFQIWLATEFFVNMHVSGDGHRILYKINAVFPLVCVILDVLAARGILADELLVESVYHLRSSRKDRKRQKK